MSTSRILGAKIASAGLVSTVTCNSPSLGAHASGSRVNFQVPWRAGADPPPRLMGSVLRSFVMQI